MTPIQYNYVYGPAYYAFNHDWIYEQAARLLTTVNSVSSPKTWNWIHHNFSPIDIVIPHCLDNETGIEVKHSVDYVEDILRKTRGFDNTIAFEAIRNYTSEISRTLLIYAGKGKDEKPINLGPGQIQAHTHKPERHSDGSYKGPRMTATVIVPIKIVEPVTETVCFSWQDIPYEKMNFAHEVAGWENSLKLSEEYADKSNVQRIKFPSEGEYLVLYFDSSQYMHWSELETNNEFLCLVHDC